MTTLKSVHKSEIANLAYSIWAGDAGLYKSNAENALKILIELNGQCESTSHGEQCLLFFGHPRDMKHRWTDGNGSGLYWSGETPPVSWKGK